MSKLIKREREREGKKKKKKNWEEWSERTEDRKGSEGGGRRNQRTCQRWWRTSQGGEKNYKIEVRAFHTRNGEMWFSLANM